MKLKIWYSNGAVQEYDSIEESQSELADIMMKDRYPFALIKDEDGVENVIVRLEKVTNGRNHRSYGEASSSPESEYQI